MFTHSAVSKQQQRAVRTLLDLFSRSSHELTMEGRTEWLEDLSGWLFEASTLRGRIRGDLGPTARLILLLDVLDDRTQPRENVQKCVAEVLAGLSFVRLLTDTGLPSESNFVAETGQRLLKSLRPERPVDGDAATLLHRLFQEKSSAKWFDVLDPPLRRRLIRTLTGSEAGAMQAVTSSMRDAVVLLAIRIASTGSSDTVRERLPHTSLRQSPFLQLPSDVALFVGRLDIDVDPTGADPEANTREGIAACRAALHDVVASLDQTGISLALVYRVEYLRLLLDRLSWLLHLLSPRPPTQGRGSGTELLRALVRGCVSDRSLMQLFQTNSRILAQRVIERVGQTGEHYITRTRAELHEMVTSAAGGGAITAVAVLAKILIVATPLPLLFSTFAIGSSYAAAFVSMQLAGFTLATKQPSMTAAALAHTIKVTEGMPDTFPLVDQVVCTIRSQLAAIVGNLGMVVPVSIAIDLVWQLQFGTHVLDAPHAAEVLTAHHPTQSGTILFAALTGVYLWMASLFGAIVENWFVMQKLAESIRTSRNLRRALGKESAERLSNWIAANIAGLAGNIGFGFILAIVPALASTAGIPLEVRHVTFVTGLLAFAGMERGAFGVLNQDFFAAAHSVLVVGFLNFAVSFTLALFVAFRARGVRPIDQLKLLAAVLRRIGTHPLDFVRVNPQST